MTIIELYDIILAALILLLANITCNYSRLEVQFNWHNERNKGKETEHQVDLTEG